MAESLGLKAKFEKFDGTTWTALAQVASITPPQPEREVVDIEDLDPADGVRKKLGGVIDAGEVTLTLNFDPADTGHTELETDFYAGTQNQYRVRLPNDNAWTFDAFISQWAPQELTEGDVFQVEVTFTVVGKPTFEPVTP